MVIMKTYVKLDGKSKKDAIEALRKLAIDMPKVCIMDTILKEDLGLDMAMGSGPGGLSGAGGQGTQGSVEMVMNYFGGPNMISKERCQSIVSSSGDLGGYDFVYEWKGKPTGSQVTILEEDIAKTLKPLKIKHTVTSN